MPVLRPLIVALALLALVAAPRLALAQMSRADIVANMTRALDEVRAHPASKERILQKIQAKAEARGARDVEAKLAALGAKLDEALALSDADYASRKTALANDMADLMAGKGKP